MGIQFIGQEDTLEEVIEMHSSILAWKITWTKEPGGLQSIGLQRVGHDGSNLACNKSLRFSGLPCGTIPTWT